MTLIAKAEGDKELSRFPLPEAGTVQAVCCGVWDLGVQRSSWNGKEKLQHKAVIAWELSQLIEAPESEYNQKPYMLSKRYTLSLYENSNLRKDLESWRGAPFSQEVIENGFDVETLYGVNCLLGVIHEPSKTDPAKVYANISTILKLPKGMEPIKPIRGKDEEPPNWVKDLQALAVVEDDREPEYRDEYDEPEYTDDRPDPQF